MDLGISSDATIDEDDAEEVFRAFRSIEKLGFGWTENTGFGAYSKWERSRLTSSLSFLADQRASGPSRTTLSEGLGLLVSLAVAGRGN